jgi:hypothetical protein
MGWHTETKAGDANAGATGWFVFDDFHGFDRVLGGVREQESLCIHFPFSRKRMFPERLVRRMVADSGRP